jgi:hypothetical protein
MLTTKRKRINELESLLQLKRKCRPAVDMQDFMDHTDFDQEYDNLIRNTAIVDRQKANKDERWQEAYDICIYDCWYITDVNAKVKTALEMMTKAGITQIKTIATNTLADLNGCYSSSDMVAVERYIASGNPNEEVDAIKHFFMQSHGTRQVDFLLQHVDEFLALGDLPAYHHTADWTDVLDLSTDPVFAKLCFDHNDAITVFMNLAYMAFDEILAAGREPMAVLLPRCKQIELLDAAMGNDDMEIWLDLARQDPTKCKRLLDNTEISVAQLQSGLTLGELQLPP